ncbi:glycosyltransferase family 2 protein [Nostoc sp. PCC 7107]|uniref:glycosyltransferase family 2 protein n=1 Tax=Nostoc sp. PCC 7107 TaxID=317936 RepID=UPI00029F30DE|nr:glycosyltransferase family 2 protein [Nostoc sp. PCC 7107]AFY44514.1 glycosyl transferase family 2 [Nostoc sp. PCC 7107]
MSQPLVTLGISTYNRAASLHQHCLAALEMLTYSNYEIIVIDDCSSDQTQDVLHEYKKKLKRLQFFRNKKNRGICYSRNRILKQSQGEIIVFCDDDVSIFPDCLDEIVKAYLQDAEVLFGWGGVYQCHSSCDSNELTFGSGSLFSLRRIVAKHFRFDTNIRYFKTYCCEEHEFARRVQREPGKIIKIPTAKANHYQAPAKNRAWRGLGGDLNYLYEKAKYGSILKYYQSLLIGIQYTIYCIILKHKIEEDYYQHYYREAVHSFHQILLLLRDGKLLIASKYLFNIIVDVPIRALIKRRIEAKQADNFRQSFEVADNIDLQSEFVQYSNFNTTESRELIVDIERTSIK